MSDDLYQEIILERGRAPRHTGRPARWDASARGDNPMCGDRIEVFLSYDAEGMIAATRFEARGCLVSVASADLMAECVLGRTPAQARALSARFADLTRTGACPDDETDLLPLRPFAGVAAYPSRIKCATLPWQALLAALDGKGEACRD
ncbi:MAG: SUF system NifU family Fe-S cluster assembly protein [Nevskia sp.]|nr:SUF system NifU family Fe-S cluster assembly protein [Nevskia sp.]